MSEEKTISSRRVYEGRAVNLRIDAVEKASGKRVTREIVEHGDCVVVVVMDAEDNVLLVRQYRKAVEKFLLEIPAGGIDPGESAEECVRRELQEEIGYLPLKIESLGGFYSTPGYCTEYLYLFLATDLVPSRREAEDTESIEVIRAHLNKIPNLPRTTDYGYFH